MRFMTLFALAVVALAVLPIDRANAQFYRFGPGGLRVRAPGVGVYVGPGGGVSVRAPFTSLYVPRYAVPPFVRPAVPFPVPYPAWYRPAPQFDTSPTSVRSSAQWPTPAQLATLEWRDLWRVLAAGAVQLDRQLDRFSTTESWQRYLKVQMLRELAAQNIDAPPDEATRAELTGALKAYDSTEANAEFNMIADLSGFGAVQSVLAELVITPQERQRRRLAQSAVELQESLDLFGSGEQWRRYLALPPEVFQPGEETAPESGTAVAGDIGPLEDALAHYNDVSSDPRYRTIARLPQFRAAYDDLSAYMAQLGAPTASATSGESSIEELPPPTPSPQQQ